MLMQIFKRMFAAYQTGETRYSPLVKKLMECMHDPACISGGLHEISSKLQYSKSYISHAFKREMGIPIVQYIKDVRLHYMAYYLNNSDLTLREICDRVGFDSLSYANKVFKEKYGASPVQYRNMDDEGVLI